MCVAPSNMTSRMTPKLRKRQLPGVSDSNPSTSQGPAGGTPTGEEPAQGTTTTSDSATPSTTEAAPFSTTSTTTEPAVPTTTAPAPTTCKQKSYSRFSRNSEARAPRDFDTGGNGVYSVQREGQVHPGKLFACHRGQHRRVWHRICARSVELLRKSVQASPVSMHNRKGSQGTHTH